MNAGYIPKYFQIKELVPPETYNLVQGLPNPWIIFDERLLWTLDQIRSLFGKPITVNNWATKGDLKYRCFRPQTYKSCALYSQHFYGRAVDFDVKGLSADQVRKEIIYRRKEEPAFQFINGLEINVPWVHIDLRNSEFTTFEKAQK